MDSIIKLIAIATIVLLWSSFTYLAGKSVYKIWQRKNIDIAATISIVKQGVLDLLPNPFSKVEKGIVETSELSVSLTPLEGYTFTPRNQDTITADFLRNRRQYLFTVANESKEKFLDVKLRVQMPYPIEDFQFRNVEKVDGPQFVGLGLSWTAHASGSGRVEVKGQPMSKTYEFRANQFQTNGKIEILLLLNNWRDPRGKIIPPEEASRYLIPEFGPTVTYIHGHFQIVIGKENIEKNFYAPLGLLDDKTIVLGTPSSPPGKLKEVVGFEF